MPSYVKAKFYGMEEHDQDRWTQNEKFTDAALAFYGDGSNLRDVYGQGGETLDDAAAKFHGSNAFAPVSANKQEITMTYDEARKFAYRT